MKVGDLVKIKVHTINGESWSTVVILEWCTPKIVSVLWHNKVHLVGQSKLEAIK